MPVLPLAQLGYLFVRTVAKPVATAIKNRMKKHPSFKRGCLQMAQAYHRWERRMKVHLMGIKLANVQPLSEEKAIELGANMLSETILFTVAGALIYVDFVRRSAKDKEKESNKLETLLTLQRELATLQQNFLLVEHEQRKLREQIMEQQSNSSRKLMNWNFLSRKPTSSLSTQQEQQQPDHPLTTMTINSAILPSNSFLSDGSSALPSTATSTNHITTTILDHHHHRDHNNDNDKLFTPITTIQSILASCPAGIPITSTLFSDILYHHRSMVDRRGLFVGGRKNILLDSLSPSFLPSTSVAGIIVVPATELMITPTLILNPSSSMLVHYYPCPRPPPSHVQPPLPAESSSSPTTTTPVIDHSPTHERPWYYRPFKWFLSTLDDIWDDLTGNGDHDDDNDTFSDTVNDDGGDVSSFSTNDIANDTS
jgi:optic atrophy 3 protein